MDCGVTFDIQKHVGRLTELITSIARGEKERDATFALRIEVGSEVTIPRGHTEGPVTRSLFVVGLAKRGRIGLSTDAGSAYFCIGASRRERFADAERPEIPMQAIPGLIDCNRRAVQKQRGLLVPNLHSGGLSRW